MSLVKPRAHARLNKETPFEADAPAHICWSDIGKCPVCGEGGNPTTGMHLPTSSDARKQIPIATGFCDYFPKAMAAVAELSRVGNDKHNPGEPLHWDKSKSTDHADCIMRHLLERGTVDTDGIRHSVKVAWRAMALLETELEGGD